MQTYEGFNLPSIDPSTLPESPEPTVKDVESMRLFVETGCIPEEYFEKIAGSPKESVALLPKSDEAKCD